MRLFCGGVLGAMGFWCAVAGADPALEDAYFLLETAKQLEFPSSVTLTIGSVEGVIGEVAQVPVNLVSEEDLPSVVILKVEYDDTKVRFLSAELGPEVPQGKLIAARVTEGDENRATYVSVIVYGFDRTGIGDGVLFVADFDVIGGQTNDVVILDGLDLADALIRFDPAEGSIVTSSAVTSVNPLPVLLEIIVVDGQIGPLTRPTGGSPAGCAGSAKGEKAQVGDMSLLAGVLLMLCAMNRFGAEHGAHRRGEFSRALRLTREQTER